MTGQCGTLNRGDEHPCFPAHVCPAEPHGWEAHTSVGLFPELTALSDQAAAYLHTVTPGPNREHAHACGVLAIPRAPAVPCVRVGTLRLEGRALLQGQASLCGLALLLGSACLQL